jgi:cytidyltransferase-like protein
MTKKVLVSGCFDLLHSGHVEFFRQAAEFGDLYIALGSDQTVFNLKGRPTINSEQERLFMVGAVKYVKEVFVSRGSGILDFEAEMRALKPDVFVVNTDGDRPEKRLLCEQLGTKYVVLERVPPQGLQARSTTALRQRDQLPYRIDLAGGWLDQPFVSKHYPGAVVTISLEPTRNFNERSGMALSTRRHAQELWGSRLPAGDYEKLARLLFAYDNPPGTQIISGSQDAIGLVFPGLAKANYRGQYWPENIDHVTDEVYLQFVENALYLVELGPRFDGFDVLANTDITPVKAQALAEAAEACWESIRAQDITAFGSSLRAGFEAQVAMFPNMLNSQALALIEQFRHRALGWKLSGAGGGGYLILVSTQEIEEAVRVVARRKG